MIIGQRRYRIAPDVGEVTFTSEHGGLIIDAGRMKLLACRLPGHDDPPCGHFDVVPDLVSSYDEAIERGWLIPDEP